MEERGMDILFFLFAAVFGILTILNTWKDRKRERYVKKLEVELEHIKQTQYVREYGVDLEECEDCHLPGDCLLCGGQ